MHELGRRISAVTDTRETGFLFQRLSVALQRGKCDLLPQHFQHRINIAVHICFLPRDATRIAVMPQYIVCPSVRNV